MFVWRGWGILVLLIVFLSFFGAHLISDFLGGKGYWELHSWPLATALFVAGGLIWIADILFLNKAWPPLVDERTWEGVMPDYKNDFFFIRMKWWGLISAGSGILILVTNTVPGF